MIQLYDTMTREKQALAPADPTHVKMYVCGPTVYDRPHIGNARSVVVYDVLFRLLKATYGENNVTYARNITDVDDKINAAATERGISIQALTEEVTAGFHADMDALHVERPTIEPRATQHIAEIVTMVEALIANGHAYVADGHVLFDTSSVKDGDYTYGQLSGRKTDDLIAGARIEVQGYKKNAGDFVLWKPAADKDDASSVFASPWGAGRPGWHIECSAMSTKHLGKNFDIHGGGADLMFPHHENEIAQSVCAHPGSHYAKLWVHNGFLTVNGEKMSKSLGNFITMQQLLERGIKGEVIRYALLSTHYRKPLDWTDKLLEDAQKSLDYLYRALHGYHTFINQRSYGGELFEALSNDLNVPVAISALLALANIIQTEKNPEARIVLQAKLKMDGALLGLLQDDADAWFKGTAQKGDGFVDALVAQRITAKKAKNWVEADRIRNELTEQGILLEDKPDGTTSWRRS